MTPIIGFAPDAEQTTIGVLSDCANLIPYHNGMEGAPSAVTPLGVPPLDDPCLGAAIVYLPSDTSRILAGTADALYELIADVWEGVVFELEEQAIDWMFAQFGETTVATNCVTDLLSSDGPSGAGFDLMTDAIQAQIIFSIGRQIMALNVNDGVTKSDGWHCSAVDDPTDWVESTTTQCASGLLVDTQGSITAGMRLGDYAVAYKQWSIYVGQYVGAPEVWRWRLVVDSNAGCVGKRALCDIGGAHFVVGKDNFWIFNGVQAVPVGDGVVRDWFRGEVSQTFISVTKCTFDRQRKLVWIFYPSSGSETCDRVLVFHPKSNRWGKVNISIQALVEYVDLGYTFDTWDDAGATYDQLPAYPFNSPLWQSDTPVLSIFNTENQLQTLSGPSESSWLATSEVGDDDRYTYLQQVRQRFEVKPEAAMLEAFYADNSGDEFTAGESSTINDGKFDVNQSARWHKAVISYTGPVRVTHQNAKTVAEGEF